MTRRAHFRLRHPPRVKLAESEVIRASKDLLHLRGYREHRLHAGKHMTPDGGWIECEPAGTPDYVAIHPRFPGFYIEFKRTGGKPSPEQEFKHRELAAWRLPVAVVDSVEALARWLDEHERATCESGTSNRESARTKI